MKTTKIFIPLLVGVALTLMPGCGKQESTPPPAPDVKPNTEKAVKPPEPPAVPKAPAESKTNAAISAPKAASTDLSATVDAAQKKAAEDKAALEKAAQEKAVQEKAAADKLAEGVKAAVTAANNVPGLLDSAKQLVADNKFAEALQILNNLAGMKLTDEQQKLVASLKDQVTKAMAQKATSEAEKAVGGLFKK
jgi:colicin import membrane protein